MKNDSKVVESGKGKLSASPLIRGECRIRVLRFMSFFKEQFGLLILVSELCLAGFLGGCVTYVEDVDNRFPLRTVGKLSEERTEEFAKANAQLRECRGERDVLRKLLGEADASIAVINDDLYKKYSIDKDRNYTYNPTNLTVYLLATSGDGASEEHPVPRAHRAFSGEEEAADFIASVTKRQKLAERRAALAEALLLREESCRKVVNQMVAKFKINPAKEYRVNRVNGFLYEVQPALPTEAELKALREKALAEKESRDRHDREAAERKALALEEIKAAERALAEKKASDERKAAAEKKLALEKRLQDEISAESDKLAADYRRKLESARQAHQGALELKSKADNALLLAFDAYERSKALNSGSSFVETSKAKWVTAGKNAEKAAVAEEAAARKVADIEKSLANVEAEAEKNVADARAAAEKAEGVRARLQAERKSFDEKKEFREKLIARSRELPVERQKEFDAARKEYVFAQNAKGKADSELRSASFTYDRMKKAKANALDLAAAKAKCKAAEEKADKAADAEKLAAGKLKAARKALEGARDDARKLLSMKQEDFERAERDAAKVLAEKKAKEEEVAAKKAFEAEVLDEAKRLMTERQVAYNAAKMSLAAAEKAKTEAEEKAKSAASVRDRLKKSGASAKVLAPYKSALREAEEAADQAVEAVKLAKKKCTEAFEALGDAPKDARKNVERRGLGAKASDPGGSKPPVRAVVED